jgi:ribonuclease HII
VSEHVVVGVDEVGRGALAGALVVGAAAFRIKGEWNPSSTCPVPDVRDSKAYKDSAGKSAARKREDAAQGLLTYPGLVAAGAGVITVEEINEWGVTESMRVAILRAIGGLGSVVPDLVLLDGYEKVDGWKGAQKSTPKADALWWPVSAASVLAKVFRDRQMETLHPQYPVYGWVRNRGYGTPEHVAALQKHGPSPHHRTTFIRSAMGW